MVNPARVSSAIAAAVRDKRHVTASVTCPTGIALKRGLPFYCVAQVGARITPFHVTQTDGSGHVTFVGVSPQHTPLLATTALADAIATSIRTSRNIRATVRCPNDIPRQRGLSFVCSAAAPSGAVTPFEVRQLDDNGHVSYRGL